MSNKKCKYKSSGHCWNIESPYYSKKCNKYCRCKNKSHYKNRVFYIGFKKYENQPILIIEIPINYEKIRYNILKTHKLIFESEYKNKYINLIITFSDTASYINFLFNDFHKSIYVESGILWITLNDIPEISRNNTPYKQMKKYVVIKRNIKSKYGNANLHIKIDKQIILLSLQKMYNQKKNEEPKYNNKNVKISKTFKNNTHNKIDSQHKNIETNNNIQLPKIPVKAIVLSNNRKCFNDNHNVIDVIAIIKVVCKNDKIVSVNIPGAYCETCNQYIILKDDFETVKKKGALLCIVEDRTPQYLEKHQNKHQNEYYGNESQIHMLGYNVMKKYNYTFGQRKIILANIIENYNITKQEILSIIDINIARHKNQPNYTEAVNKWSQDRSFVANYKTEDCLLIPISEIVIGRK